MPTLSSVPEENKYGVSKWLIEALKPYDSLLATGDKGKKMKAKRELEALINQQIKSVLDSIPEPTVTDVFPSKPYDGTNAYEDMVQVVKWYKSAIQKIKERYEQ